MVLLDPPLIRYSRNGFGQMGILNFGRVNLDNWFSEIFKGPLYSCLERYIGLGLGVGLGFVGQRGLS